MDSINDPQFSALALSTLYLVAKVVLAAIFGVAGIAKFFDLKGSERAVRDFGIPEGLAKPLALLLPAAEVVIAYILLTEYIWYGAIASALMLIVFIIGMIIQIAQNNEAECHCFGQLYSEKVDFWSVGRNVVFLILALILVLAGWAGDPPSYNNFLDWLWKVTASENVAAQLYAWMPILLAAAAVVYLRKIALSFEINRLLPRADYHEPAESAAHTHAHGNHEHNTSPDEGLPVGAPAPDFALASLEGRAVSFEQLLMNGRPMLFFFITPTCSPCKGMLPQIGKWQDELRGKVDFVFISTGTAEDNLAKLPELGGQVLLLQKKRETAESYLTKWTPTALLINAAGNIASRPAAGDTAIGDLIDLIKEETGEITFVENGRGMAPNKLMIGQEIPAFSLSGTNGETVTDQRLRGRASIVMFFGLDCSHCHRMLPEVKEWETSAGRSHQLIVFSSGDAERNRAEIDLKSPVLLDPGNKAGLAMGQFGTPSALLVDAEGRIASETAVGARQMWALVGKSSKS